MKVLEVFLLLEMTSILQVNSWTPYPVNCQWNSYGPWSECDGCSKTQTRRRTVVVYGQYGGNPCSGSAFETQPCVPVVGCPVEEGCGNRFRCFSGQCIRKTLVCNGDSDCENDSSDEDQCEDRKTVCDIDKVPLNAELTGAGFNLITGEFKKNVIHTKSFGGTCRKVFSGDRPEYYRLSESMLAYTFQVEIKNDFSYEFYNSKWSYVKVTERQVSTNYQESEYKYQTFTEDKEKSYQLMVIKNDVEVAQFLNNAPEVLPLAESFWKELANLPAVYDYNAYRRLIDNYGTHFLQSGSLGGEYKVIFYVDTEKMKEEGISIHDMNKCSTSSRGFLFFKKTTTKCQKIHNVFRSSSGSSSQEIHGDAFILGGEPKFVAGLSYLDLDNPAGNEARYASWAGSVKKVPSVIKQKITPLYELVKEVPCASVKKYYLKQAIQEYLTETDPCKCRPCQSNGQPVLMGTQCQCLCRPYTFGEACERGVLVEDQPGVIDGSWSCWSSWSSCVTERRSRSRSCSNPHPSGGGKSCIGENFENQQCDNEDLKHLRMIEPHCFDTSVIPTEFCTPPPALENGFVQDSGPFYPVGRAVVYSCTDGYALLGDPVAKCGEDMKWQIGNMQCKRIACTFPALQANVRGAPWNSSYQIGEKVTLSCPAGMRLEGAAIILCESSLKWSPDVKEIQCKSESPTEVPKPAGPTCQPWEKLQQSKCTCKMPYECGSSLDICAVDAKNNKNVALTVCKMHALECLGRKYTLTDQDTCTIPAVAEHSCDGCHLWEKCDDQTNRCVCREERVCKDGGISVCIQVNGEITKQTMSECEAGILKCQGQNITIVSIRPCDM
ncbi:LOW QUALITY PROTEIN: complement component C7 [Rhinatrema bivittatum]|uniref:LOW QUALITY PROTEIN: complement component C7 n=1 Tax=Rhinatrema bivittatum TaxID=194408 RepID=UPI00112AB6A2|nr:LOW QUALITY PROTEIN: complement component C7 [Rhinatrema bivittatum]